MSKATKIVIAIIIVVLCGIAIIQNTVSSDYAPIDTQHNTYEVKT